MSREPIYVAYALIGDGDEVMPLCWHAEKQRAGEVGEALAKQEELAFWGIFACNHADYQAINYFPDNHPLNAKPTND